MTAGSDQNPTGLPPVGWVMRIEEGQRQTCKVCGWKDKFDYHLPDEVWRMIVPTPYQNHVVCLSCLDDFAHEKGVHYADALQILYFAGRAATLVFSKT